MLIHHNKRKAAFTNFSYTLEHLARLGVVFSYHRRIVLRIRWKTA